MVMKEKSRSELKERTVSLARTMAIGDVSQTRSPQAKDSADIAGEQIQSLQVDTA